MKTWYYSVIGFDMSHSRRYWHDVGWDAKIPRVNKFRFNDGKLVGHVFSSVRVER